MDIKVVHDLSIEENNALETLIRNVGWNKSQLHGQINSIKKFISDHESIVFFAKEHDKIIGFITAQFYSWNKLGQIHGLVVDPEFRRNNIASLLVGKVENFLKSKNARGIYVDTPIDNEVGKKFYESNNFKEAYVMPQYYDVGKDGVTYLKIF